MVAMKKPSTIDILNMLVQMHCRSLPMYLSDATPWSASQHSAGQELLQSIVADQGEIVDQLASLIQGRDAIVERGAFPIAFTDLNDLSLDYVMREVAERQTRQVAALERATELLADDDEALKLGQRALGVGRAHLDSLNDYVRAQGQER